MTGPNPSALDQVRAEMQELRDQRRQLSFQASQLDAELAESRRDQGEDDPHTTELDRRRQALAGQIAGLSGVERRVRRRYGDLVGELLGDDIEHDFDALDAGFPILLLPVRLETRFVGAELLVRVYPDEIVADGHEPELTPEERTAGEAFWTAAWPGLAAEQIAWRNLVAAMPATRAAWVVQSTKPTNADDQPRPPNPSFPTPPEKSAPWTRASETRMLPDRWVALGYRGGSEVVRAVAAHPIVEPLILSLSPEVDPATQVDISNDGLEVDQLVAWTVDFAAAEAAGMALRVPLNVDLQQTGLDELLVLGVKRSLSPVQVSDRLSALLAAHHYTRGLALVRQGTPSNNTSVAPSGFPPTDTRGALSFAVERGKPLATEGSDGERLARALGVATTVFDHIDGAGRNEQAAAAAMNDAVWPATWGYFLEQLLEIKEGASAVDAFHGYFAEHVRGRGHQPLFRVGYVPYGLLVASSLQRWQTRGERTSLELRLPDELRRLASIWGVQVPGVPRSGATDDPDSDLVHVLEMDASTREVRVRSVTGPTYEYNLIGLMGMLWDGWAAERARLALDVARLLGRTEAASRIFTLTYGAPPRVFASGFVNEKPSGEREPLSETDPLAWNYITWLRTASLSDLRTETLPAGVSRPTVLLYLLLRHALLTFVKRTGDGLLVDANLIAAELTREPELIGMAVGAAGPTEAAAKTTANPVWDRLEMAVPNVTGGLPLSRYLFEVTGQPATAGMERYRASLAVLEVLPTAELERLLTESLDVCSHRLDAWISSLFVQRLEEMRGRERQGNYLGAFGWVEGLRPAPRDRRTRVSPQGLPRALARDPIEIQISTGGHIHAPSMSHAAAAAVLRSGYLSRRGANKERYALTLSSARVRQARWLLDAVRSGQTLGAVLGYQFERGLHEGHRPLQLDKYVEPFRRHWPLTANQLDQQNDPNLPIEAMAARNVVDGLALHRAWRDGAIPWGTDDLPPPAQSPNPATPTDRDACEAELRAIDEVLDSLTDLLTAESVFQLVRGNTAGASASLDSLARGVRPPDPEITRAPRDGTTLGHRTVLVLGGAALTIPAWGGIPASPRSRAEPFLDAWLGTLLGDPARIRARVTYTDAAAPTVTHQREVSLADLRLRPLDALAVIATADAGAQTDVGEPATTAQASELDARIAWVVLGQPDAAQDGKIEILYAPWDRDSLVSFPEAAELLRAVGAVLSSARPLDPSDLLATDKVSLAETADRMPAEAATRANAAVNAITTAVGALDAAIAAASAVDLRSALIAASAFGIPGAIPATRTGSNAAVVAALTQQATSVRAELDRRRQAATAATDDQSRVRAVFGDAFVFLPRFRPVAGEIGQALSVGPVPTPTPTEVRTWLHGASLIRAPLERWKRAGMVARALGAPVPRIQIAQLPHRAAPWAALPFDPSDETARPQSGTLSLAIVVAPDPDATPARLDPPATTDPWVGLVIDDWSELIPLSTQSTAVAFHYDDPGAEAPQALLLAVPPDNRERWSLDVLSTIVRETFQLAKIRGVDWELLGSLSQVLPATYLAANPKNDTIATRFTSLLATEAVIVRGA